MRSVRLRHGLLVSLLLGSSVLLAQSEEDALRMSTVNPGGTARSNGMANAFGALGADAASIGINPGGLGLYRTSELSLTPMLEVNEASSLHYGNRAADSRTRFAFSSLALAINNPSEKGGDWRSSTYGVIFDRQATHNWRRTAQANAVPTTILQGFANEADGTPDDRLFDFFPFTAGLAWETFGIDPGIFQGPNGDTIPNRYVSAIPLGEEVDQLHTIESTGNTNNTAFFYAGNYRDLLYVGASVGIVGHRFRRTTIHQETTLNENLDFRDLIYREELSTTASGIDIKLGIVGRVSDRVRLGAAYHSPQWMRMNDAFSTNLRTNFRTPDNTGRTSYSAASPDGVFSYRLNSPMRVVLSGAYIAGANGLVSVDYTYTDFRDMRFRPGDRFLNDYDFAFENDVIANAFRSTHSLRVGTEWRNGNWYYRMGGGFMPSAYRNDEVRQSTSMRTYAGGLGYRTDHVAVDLALNYVQGQMVYFQYDPAAVQATVEDRRHYRAMLTLSFRP